MKKNCNFIFIFFIFIFVILFTLDLTYKKYVVNLSVGHKYKISAAQAFSLKEKNYQTLVNEVLIFDKNRNVSENMKILELKTMQF